MSTVQLTASADYGQTGEPMLTIKEVCLLVESRGVSLSAFWREAMGGDYAPLRRATVLSIVDRIAL